MSRSDLPATQAEMLRSRPEPNEIAGLEDHFAKADVTHL